MTYPNPASDRPIIFSGEMVRALLAGRKTQTRRVLKPQPTEVDFVGRWYRMPFGGLSLDCHRLPYVVGQRLWVREAFGIAHRGDSAPGGYHYDPEAHYRAEDPDFTPDGPQWEPWRRRSPIHMPRWASRVTLTVTDVRVERLQAISEDDARAEGVDPTGWVPSYANPDNSGCDDSQSARDAFSDLWDTLRGPGSWDADPWVTVLTFTTALRNIDEVST